MLAGRTRHVALGIAEVDLRGAVGVTPAEAPDGIGDSMVWR
jgi:hypothetical protein